MEDGILLVIKEAGIGIQPDVASVLYVERDAQNVLITVQESVLLIAGGGGGGGDRQEIFLDETPAVNYPAIALVAGSVAGFRKLKVNI